MVYLKLTLAPSGPRLSPLFAVNNGRGGYGGAGLRLNLFYTESAVISVRFSCSGIIDIKRDVDSDIACGYIQLHYDFIRSVRTITGNFRAAFLMSDLYG